MFVFVKEILFLPTQLVLRSGLCILLAAVMFLAAGPANGANATWNGTTDALWATGTNWSATPVPGSGNTATFNNGGGANDTIDLGGGVTINSIVFDTTNVAPYVIGAGAVSAQTLTLNNGGGTTVGSGNKSYSPLFNAAVLLGTDGTTQNFTLTNNSSRNLAMFGNITGSTGAGVKTLTIASSGTGNVNISNGMGTGGVISDGAGGGQVRVVVNNTGTGITTFNAFNVHTFTGGLHIQAGTLATTAGNATFGDPANAITLGNNTGSANTTLISGRNSATPFTNPITIAGGNTGTATISSTGNTTFGGTITLGNGDGAHNLTLLSNSGTLTVSGDIAGTGNLTLDMGMFTQIALSGASINPTGTITNKGHVYIANDATISGNIGGAVQGVIQDSATVELNLRGVNTYTSATTINRGTINLGNANGSLNGTTGTALIFNGTGAFNVSEASGVSQGMGALTVNGGEATLRSQNNGGNSFLTFASLSPLATGAAINFTTNGGSSATNKISLTNSTNAPLTTTSNDPGMFFNGSAYARYDVANTRFQAVAYGTDTNANPLVANGGGTVAAGPVTLGTISAITDVQFQGDQSVAAGQSTANGSGTNSTTLVVQPGHGVRFAVGAPVTGTGITANTWITAISGDTLTLSRPSTWANAAPIRPNYLVTGQTTGDVNTLNIIGNGESGAIRLAAAQTLGINGVLISGAGNGHVSVISGGTAIQPAVSGGEIVLRNNTTNDRLEINSVIQNNTTASGLTKSGPGQTTLTGANTYTGTTTINAGILTADHSQALGVGGNITFSGGSHPTDIANLLTAGVLQYTSNSNAQDWSSRIKNSSGAVFVDVNATAVTLGSVIDSSNTGGLMVTNSSATAGSITLSGANTFTGDATLLGGGAGALTVSVGHSSALGSGTIVIRTANAAPVLDASAPGITLSNPMYWSSNFTFVGTNNLTMTGPVTIDGNRVVTVNGGTLTVNGDIGQSGGRTMTKAGAGTLVLNGSNSYTGTTTIQAGTVSINSIKNVPLVTNAGGEPSSLGAPTNGANGTIGIGTGTNATTLRYTGTGDTTNRVINQGGSTVGATLDQSGTGLLLLTGNVTASGGGSKTLTLQGSTAGIGEISGVISNNSGTNLVSVLKSGTGTWILSGTNTYTSTTDVSVGTLVLNGTHQVAGATNVGNYTVAGSATLGGFGTTDALIQGAGLISPGNSPGILTVGQVNPTGGMDFGFELTQTGNPLWSNAAASANDVLRITDATTPFTAPLSLANGNEVDIYFNAGPLANYEVFRGGFFTDLDADFLSTISGATYNFWVLDGSGSESFGGNNYSSLATIYPTYSVTVSTFQVAGANFAVPDTGNGWVTEFTINGPDGPVAVPEPATVALLAVGSLIAVCILRQRLRPIRALE